MKSLVLLVLFSISTHASAATLNLGGGETVTVQANVPTTVTCGGGASGGNCDGPKAAFIKIMEQCAKSYGGGECSKKHWGPFKLSNSQCSYAGVDTCISYCTKSYGGGECAVICQ